MKRYTDKQRLDWLSRQEHPIEVAAWWPSGRWSISKGMGGGGPHIYGPTVRAAIDAAMRADEKARKGD